MGTAAGLAVGLAVFPQAAAFGQSPLNPSATANASPFDELPASGQRDAKTRIALARSLASRPATAAEPLLVQLSHDPDQAVRTAALESARSTGGGAVLRQRIAEMAATDPDAIVRGYARLLAAEWGADAAPANSTPAELLSDGEERPLVTTMTERETPPRVMPPFDQSAPLPANLHAPTHTLGVGTPTRAGGTQSVGTLNALRPVAAFWTAPVGSPAVNPLPVVDVPEGDQSAIMQTTFADSGAAGSALVSAIGQFPDFDPRLDSEDDAVRPDVLNRPLESPFEQDPPDVFAELEPLYLAPIDPPLGFSGPSSIVPRDVQESPHFVPREDRWRIGFPYWDRYERGNGLLEDYPFDIGSKFNPYRQHVLKGDYPIMGQHTFLNVTATNLTVAEGRRIPARTTPFEVTRDPFQEKFFGDPDQFLFVNQTSLRIDLFHANDAAFKPVDWQIRLTPVFNVNNTRFGELTLATPDPYEGIERDRTDVALEEYFVEAKLADLSPDYDFMSVRAGSQFFNSDFRGFIFADTNRAVRLFGTRFSSRDQFNLLFFDQTDKDINSGLNEIDQDRQRNTIIANYYRQDFVFPGYTAQASYHYNVDHPDFEFDENKFLARPDPVGVFQPHRVDSHYFGITGDGHIGRINVSNAFYFVVGKDSLNPLAGKEQDIAANMQAIELSLDRDWVRFRMSWFRASGDSDINDDHARGFDAIFDNPSFAGGTFSYWVRQPLPLFGVVVTDRNSLLPNLKSSRIKGQTNFVNPGVSLVNFGADFEVTPKTRLITNANYLWFESTDVLETFTFQNPIDEEIGLDLSVGMEYRPLLSDNIIILGGLATLIPGAGLQDIFGNFSPTEVGPVSSPHVDPFWHAFMEVTFAF